MSERLAKRKTHKKSRKGCLQCKQRHNKCNEVRPRCANCVRIDIDCTWPSNPNTSSSPSSQIGPVTTSAVASPNLDFGISDQTSGATSLRINDMRLLHHWVTKAAKSLHPQNVQKYEMWQGSIVDLSFDHPFVLHGLLGMAALHKAGAGNLTDRAALAVEADHHISVALGIYRKKLEHPILEEALPMFILSSILVNYNFGSANLQEPEHPLSAVEHCFRLLRGVRVVIHPHWQQLRETETFLLMAGPAMNPATEPGPHDAEIWEVRQLKQLTADQDPLDGEACAEAIDELHRAFVRTRKCSQKDDNEYAVMMSWPATLSETFINLLSLHNPVVLIILLHFAVLMDEVRYSWWTKGWPQRILRATRDALHGNPALQKWLDWPGQRIKHSISSNNT
ncbi:hypothetical protein K491DRAFT_702202 [Lophiostoma macrostomum CBS 122681]|uniref:Zn(2)-C6 fungal-type domain-containing protein n=1 Tax=Lophiostoma macrostomum CBS 122681 TaxID=1314788 RepID=A0A6A6TK55_9PLEO|nr:hypothetical protein K491DRAFT_702202 [Lophiostoma macrostomum CBS 122681]